jgi:hypothetical protein
VGQTPAVALHAVAEGESGLRHLRSGDRVGPGERVVFRLSAPVEGELSLAEADGTPIWPVTGSWSVQAGSHFLGDPPLAWVPDHPGPTTVVARLCVGPGDCGTASFTVVAE